MARKLRIYLDTSAISYLDQQDAPERMKETQEAWEILKTGKYEIIISSLALSEVSECNEEKQERLMDYIEEINYIEYEIDEETRELAKLVIQEGILTPKSIDDATHIAAAILTESDIILSWNFKHLVNIDTINGIRKICFSKNIIRFIDIYAPNILLKRGEDDNE